MIVCKIDHAERIGALIVDQRAIILMGVQYDLDVTVVNEAVIFERSVEQVHLILK